MDQLNVGEMFKLQRAFVDERKWKKFHTPKNLSMALAGEAAELMESWPAKPDSALAGAREQFQSSAGL